jgi:hypothetical protein
MSDETADSWERFLNPQLLRDGILVASVYIVAFEILKESVIEKLKSFYTHGFDKNGPNISPSYKKEVLALNRSPLPASLIWLVNNGALNASDLAKFETVKQVRNKFAHEMLEFLVGDPTDYPAQPFFDMVELLRKIEIWWFENLEMAIAPEEFPNDLNLDDVTPGRVLALQLLIKVALDPEEDAKTFYDEYMTLKGKSSSGPEFSGPG